GVPDLVVRSGDSVYRDGRVLVHGEGIGVPPPSATEPSPLVRQPNRRLAVGRAGSPFRFTPPSLPTSDSEADVSVARARLGTGGDSAHVGQSCGQKVEQRCPPAVNAEPEVGPERVSPGDMRPLTGGSVVWRDVYADAFTHEPLHHAIGRSRTEIGESGDQEWVISRLGDGRWW